MPRNSLLFASNKNKKSSTTTTTTTTTKGTGSVHTQDLLWYDEEVLIPLLAQKSYHLPGNTWKQDWIQFQKNNHIVFGICMHHKLHPIEWWERIIVLLGSMSFALLAINIYYLVRALDYSDRVGDPSVELYSITIAGTEYAITQGTVVLWTFGSLCSAIFDFAVWQTSACACFHPGGRCYGGYCSKHCKDLGSYVLIPIVVGVMGLAAYASYLRTHDDVNQDEDGNVMDTDDVYDQVTGGTLGEFSFIVKYAVELLLSWFVWFPLFSTVMFSGVLGCGVLPVLGGRPRDKKRVEKDLAERGKDGVYASF